MSNETTLQRVAEELAGRIGQITAQYESQIAILKVQAAEQNDALSQRITELEEELSSARSIAVPGSKLDKPTSG